MATLDHSGVGSSQTGVLVTQSTARKTISRSPHAGHRYGYRKPSRASFIAQSLPNTVATNREERSSFREGQKEEDIEQTNDLAEETKDETEEEDSDTDLEDMAVSTGYQFKTNRSYAAVYLAACRKYHVIPSRHFLNYLCQDIKEEGRGLVICMNNKSIDATELRPILVAIRYIGGADVLEIEGNTFGNEGMDSLTAVMCENIRVKSLNVSNNQLGHGGARCLGNILRQNDHLNTLSAAGNNFLEKDAFHFVEALKQNHSLSVLDLSHNAFREDGGFLIGHLLATNDCLRKVNLSWNHLRMKGAMAIASGLKTNDTLEELNLSWNGFANEGAKALGQALMDNSTLVTLNLDNNRINAIGVAALAEGLKYNETLEKLTLGMNPITSVGAVKLLSLIRESQASNAIQIDMQDVSVTYDLEIIVSDIQSRRPFKMKHGGFLPSPDVIGERILDMGPQRLDPFKLLMIYCQTEGLRLWDLFARFDKDGSMCISKEEFLLGIKASGLPLPMDQIEKLANMLDKDHDGEIDFGELLSHQKDFIYNERKKKSHEKKYSQVSVPKDPNNISLVNINHFEPAISRPSSSKRRLRKISAIEKVISKNSSRPAINPNDWLPPVLVKDGGIKDRKFTNVAQEGEQNRVLNLPF